MHDYLEAILLLFPPEAGGRGSAIEPREGSYRPYASIGDRSVRLRVIEGPARIAPGDSARVVLEIEATLETELLVGDELRLFEHGVAPAGVLTVLRHIRRALAV